LNFVLTPFHASSLVRQINGSVTRDGSCLNLQYQFSGTSSILLNEPVDFPERRDRLWESTCFECFIGLSSADRYLECNLSSAGHWQAYEFEGYRTIAHTSKDFRVSGDYRRQTPDNNIVRCSVDINHPDFVTEDWHISPAVILKEIDGPLQYFAASHPDNKPDFHLASQRTLILPCVR
tara:strand:- start:21025 stop:21558 length:534 start_codon:yes stop_codon:yes gene_type:complete